MPRKSKSPMQQNNDKHNNWHVFISYSTRDKFYASLIYNDLVNAGLHVWQDVDQIKPGDRIRESISYGISRCRAVIVLLSKNSLRSRWVLNELDEAMLREITENQKIVIPILIGRISQDEIPGDLKGKKFIDLRNNFSSKYKINKKSLIQTLSILSEMSPPGALQNEVELGEDSIELIFNYKYLGIHELENPPIESINIVADTFFKVLSSDDEVEENDGVDFLIPGIKGIINEYGYYGARKIFYFFLDHSDISLTKGFSEDEMNSLFLEISGFYLYTEVSKQLIQERGLCISMGALYTTKLRTSDMIDKYGLSVLKRYSSVES